jgi:4-amino-4-deoxy-L-arabinose transferase-like glycosyltransferase
MARGGDREPRKAVNRSRLSLPASRAALVVAVALVLAWMLVMGSIPGSQDFPLGDDYAFAQGAIRFARGEGVHYGYHASIPLLGQWLWATPFLWVGSEWPHVALRISTVLLGGLGLCAFYDLLRRDGFDPGQAGFLTGVLAFNPLYFLLQGTFMSDVPALAFALIALALYRRAMDTDSLWTLIGAALAAILAVSTRQNAIAAPLAIAVVVALRPDLRRRWSWGVAIALPILIGISIQAWFTSRRDIWPIQATLELNMTFLAVWAIVAQMVGLLLLPVLLQNAFAVSRSAPHAPRFTKLIFPIACLLVIVALVYWGTRLTKMQVMVPGDDFQPWFPYTMPMLGPYGPFSAVQGYGPLFLPVPARQLLTVVGIFAAAAVISRLLNAPLKRSYSSPIVLYSVIQGLLFILAPRIYDRYFLVLLPGVMAAIAERTEVSVARRRIGWLGLTAMAMFSIALMHDWLSWNEARWSLGRKAVANGIHPWEIEGGLEWNGWYDPATQPDLPPISGMAEILLTYNLDLHFFHVIGRYDLSAERLAHTLVRDRWPYTVWLPPGRRFFLLLEHVPAASRHRDADIKRAPDPSRAFP